MSSFSLDNPRRLTKSGSSDEQTATGATCQTPEERKVLVQQAKDFAWGYCYAYAGVEDLTKALKDVLDELFDLTDEETASVIEASV